MDSDHSFIYTRNFSKTGINFLSDRSYAIPCLIALLNVIVTYFSVIYFLDHNKYTIYYISILNILIFISFSYHVIRHIYALRRTSKVTHYGSRFRYRLVLLFTIAAILPVLLLGLFSSIAFRNAAKGWFDVKVESAVNNAQYVADAYIKEHNNNIRADIFATEADLQKALTTVNAISDTERHLKMQLLLRDLSAIKIFNEAGQEVTAIYSDYYTQKNNHNQSLSVSQILNTHQNNPFIEVDTETYHIHAFKIVKFNKKFYILNITRPVNEKAVQYNNETKKAVSDYNIIKVERRKSELGFALIYISFGIFIIVFMVKAGQYFALQMTKPLEVLTLTAQQIEAGNENVRCPPPKKIRDEIDRLMVAFNQMIDKLSNEKKLTSAVLKGVSTGVVCLDNHYNISLINQRAMDIFKVDQASIKTLINLSPDFHDFITLLKQLDTPKATQKFNKLYLLNNGDKVHLHLRYAIHDAPMKMIRYIITIDDISELMRAQSTAAWQDIAQRIAHEIKNPLTPISLATEHIQRKWGKEIQTNKESFTDMLNIIQKQVSHILDTANSLSELAKMPPPIFTKIDIYQIIKDVINLEELRTSITFSIDIYKPVFLSGDERLLSQVLINIFKNSAEAIEYHQIKNGIIDVLFQISEHSLKIIIRDNGKGLPKDIPRNTLFNPYVTTKEHGTGIGLAITGKIITDHNGKIDLQNYLDPETEMIIGTEVIIDLPLEIHNQTV
ncbi:MAG: two-component system nitrogen regulation sensor histidine kinase NtrY [Alphaproteobacteria bacterium]|jgi:two-component system nitrogen regulation sensor histidine kinase NtrY